MPHINDQLDFCVETFIVYQNKVLLRLHDKLNIWLSIGGHIELNEDPIEAAQREIQEEVGLEVEFYLEKDRQPNFNNDKKSLIPPQYLNRHPISDTHDHVVLVYFAKTNTNKLKLSQTEKSEGCKWFAKEDLLENKEDIREDIIFYALKALIKLAE